MNQVALEKTEKWIQDVLIPCTKAGKSFDVSKEMISITLDAICKTAFEYEVSEIEKDNFVNNLELQLKEFLTKSINNPFRKYLGTWIPDRKRALKASKDNSMFARKIIANYRANPDPLPGTIIDCLCRNPCYANDDELAADVVLFLTAGHDVSSIQFLLMRSVVSNPTGTDTSTACCQKTSFFLTSINYEFIPFFFPFRQRPIR